ncbi:MAG: thioredoxin family protein [Candidatus Binataceae bacterium]
MNQHPIVSQEQWVAARKQLLEKEKEFTAALDALNNQRRELPWVKLEKEYVFDTAHGKKTLADLFDGRSQLIVYHFMLGPGWKAGCTGCSFLADHVDGANLHLAHHDVSFTAVSRAPLAEIEAYKKRMGWRFKWVSSNGNDFNFDYHVSFKKDEMAQGKVYYNYQMTKATTEELPGTSVFFKDDSGAVFHTYSSYARGDERSLGTYMFLDLTPKGRDENGPNYNLMDWVRRHDEYGNGETPEDRH